MGVVEDRMDPLYLGRCRVRVVGLHTDNLSDLPTEDLPWAYPVSPITSASMNGIGQTPLGPVEGTWVALMFLDEENQQPVMIGTVGGIPVLTDTQVTDSVLGNSASSVVTTGSNGTLVDSSGTAVESSGMTADQDNDLSKIPTNPPAGTKNATAASAGIKAIIAACKAANITSRNAVAVILGVIGGESMWVPTNEGYQYSPERLKTVYPNMTADQVQKYANAKKNGMSPEIFFSFVYGAESNAYNGGKNGKLLENLDNTDGGKFYGRGFLQLTGRSNYNRYTQLSGVDITGNPNILNSDINASAKVAVAYVLDRCKLDQKSAAYFDGVKKAVGFCTPDIAAKKRSYYEYFLGGEQPTNQTDPLPVASAATIAAKPSNGRGASSGRGFVDPNNMYPKQDWINEPDTNRLARRHKLTNTIYQKKKDGLTKNIAIANSSKIWDQMRLPYNASYPFNHVIETESGHVLEFDDTENCERIQLYHTSGTFFEIDADGNKSEKILGASTLITEADSMVCIQGSSHHSIGADGSINIGGHLQIQVTGNVNIVVNGNVYQTVNGETNINSTGNLNLNTGGDFNLNADGVINVRSGREINIGAGSSINAKSGGIFAVDSPKIQLNSKMAADTKTTISTTPTFTPTVRLPEAFNVEEISYVELEDFPSRRGQIHDDNNTSDPVSTIASDTTTPAPQGAIIQKNCEFPDTFGYDLQLSPNYNLGSLCLPDKGKPFPFKEGQHGLTAKALACNLQKLCVNILEPLRLQYNDQGFKLNSGFRYAGAIVKTGNTSQHELGMAVDISCSVIRGIKDYEQRCAKFYEWAIKIRDSGLPYDQLIFESDPGKGFVWLHVSFNPLGPRPVTDKTKILTYAGKSQGYVPGLHQIVGGKVV